MRRRERLRALPLLAAALVLAGPRSTGAAETPAGASRASLADLAWMAGSWETASGGFRQVDEHWSAPAGGTMMGMSRTVAGNRTVEFEFLRLEERKDGVFYVAQPSGRCPATDFQLTHAAGGEAIFENPQHDFPKRIIYRKNADGSLTASIDGGEGTRSTSFDYRRAGM
jgi:hypothetical protein